MANIDYTQYGLAEIQTDAFTQVELIAGDTPPIVTDYGILGATLNGTGIAAWTPVYVEYATEGSGFRAISLDVAGGGQAPNAIVANAVPAGAGATATVQVYRAGMFNVNAINWPASYDTLTKKLAAFNNSADCQIYLKAPAVV